MKTSVPPAVNVNESLHTGVCVGPVLVSLTIVLIKEIDLAEFWYGLEC